MSDLELRANAMIAEVESQRDWALQRLANTAAEMATLRQRIAELEKSESTVP